MPPALSAARQSTCTPEFHLGSIPCDACAAVEIAWCDWELSMKAVIRATQCSAEVCGYIHCLGGPHRVSDVVRAVLGP